MKIEPEILRSLTPEQFAKLKPLSEEQIREAILKGFQPRDNTKILLDTGTYR
jgi:hypothetical protein